VEEMSFSRVSARKILNGFPLCAPNTAEGTVLKKESPKRFTEGQANSRWNTFKSGEPPNVLLLALVFCQNETS